MNFKEIKAEQSTITYNREEIEAKAQNIYESIVIVAKRAKQINAELKEELVQKLDEFASHNDTLEEIFENREQIEVSKFYERLPKPTSIALKQWMEDQIYYRKPEKD
ncbi:MAG: hypothetical protein C4K58_04415 [Flavobacteriaceae bacterium]|nr:MAG: hypothetical protein C4K58_04415 [Flavobacteriaceae bacterium]